MQGETCSAVCQVTAPTVQRLFPVGLLHTCGKRSNFNAMFKQKLNARPHFRLMPKLRASNVLISAYISSITKLPLQKDRYTIYLYGKQPESTTTYTPTSSAQQLCHTRRFAKINKKEKAGKKMILNTCLGQPQCQGSGSGGPQQHRNKPTLSLGNGSQPGRPAACLPACRQMAHRQRLALIVGGLGPVKCFAFAMHKAISLPLPLSLSLPFLTCANFRWIPDKFMRSKNRL